MVVQKETRSVIAKLNQKHQQEFFNAVQERFVTACDYIRPKFPLKDVARINAEVVELRAVDRMSFQKVLFFCGALPSHVGPTTASVQNGSSQYSRDGITATGLWHVYGHTKARISYAQWRAVWQLRGADGLWKFSRIDELILGILSVPHSNAECEWQFSIV